MNEIILQGVSKEELINDISSAIANKINIPPDQIPSTPNLKDKKQAAEYLNISVRKLDDLTLKGKIRYSKSGV